MKSKKTSAWNDGFAAQRAGTPVDGNPWAGAVPVKFVSVEESRATYPTTDQSKKRDWERGWRAADSQTEGRAYRDLIEAKAIAELKAQPRRTTNKWTVDVEFFAVKISGFGRAVPRPEDIREVVRYTRSRSSDLWCTDFTSTGFAICNPTDAEGLDEQVRRDVAIEIAKRRAMDPSIASTSSLSAFAIETQLGLHRVEVLPRTNR